MNAVVLESIRGSDYRDSGNSYEFPQNYLKQFESLDHGEPILAIIYEPRGGRNGGERGRMAYIAWASITQPPVPVRDVTVGRKLWQVNYVDGLHYFSKPVPREAGGEPIESWLRPYERGRQRNIATQGKAVRSINIEDLKRIMELGGVEIPNAFV